MYLTQGLHRAGRLHPAKVALREGERSWTYAALADWAARKAGVLRASGVQPGERVALLGANGAGYVSWLLACWWLGAVVQPLNARWSPGELAHGLADGRPRLLLVDQAMAPRMAGVAAPADTAVVSAEELEAHALEAAALEDVRAGGDTLAAILYTGGTTGFPKGAMLTHANLWSAAVARLATVPTPADSCTLLVAPLFHVAGLGRLIGQFVAGASVVVQPGFDVKAVLQSLQDDGVCEVLLVPSMLQMLLDLPEFKRYRLDGVRRVIWGASPIAPALLERALAAFPQAEFVHAYGMTETAATAAINAQVRQGGARAGSVGRPVVGVEARILAPDGREVETGVIGELAIRGPMVMRGYWNQPEETRRAFARGWLLTGDAARQDEDGYLYVVDRLKDMIVSGGENVYGAEVEDVLAQHAQVAHCAVIGVAHERWGEAVHAVIVPRPGAAVDADSLNAHCRQRLAAYKCPKTYEFRRELPMSAAGKVLKSVLRQVHESQRAASAAPTPQENQA
ncbi:long-chain fatty acid--CoA ligase [Achromobacter denitrificans]|uniref:acyl-CoA synthetase n=1 Tax=Achromobacter denitrificans TaxID=32002 RepID=UPI0023E8A8A7|nr:long-chain fatty acid--CoA ligase [Achromobacter denitrificans]MDF3858916.1 long-chain fatty acid--CoA ligase [Achromobacter denitrificans]